MTKKKFLAMLLSLSMVSSAAVIPVWAEGADKAPEETLDLYEKEGKGAYVTEEETYKEKDSQETDVYSSESNEISESEMENSQTLSGKWFDCADGFIIDDDIKENISFLHNVFTEYKKLQESFYKKTSINTRLISDDVLGKAQKRNELINVYEKSMNVTIIDASNTYTITSIITDNDMYILNVYEYVFFDYQCENMGAKDVSGYGINHTITVAKENDDYIMLVDDFTDDFLEEYLPHNRAESELEHDIEVFGDSSMQLFSANYNYNYSPSVAAEYADKWVPHSINGGCNPNYYNKEYTYYSGNDCANFVSQCLYAGGMLQTSSWKPGVASWTTVAGLRDYFNNYGTNVALNANNISSAVWKGCPLYIKNSSNSHVVICTGYAADGWPYLDGHTNDRYHQRVPTNYYTNTIQIIPYKDYEPTPYNREFTTSISDGDLLIGSASIQGIFKNAGTNARLELYLDYGYISTSYPDQNGNYSFRLDTNQYGQGKHLIGIKWRNDEGLDYTNWYNVYFGDNTDAELLEVWYENITSDGFDVVCKVKNAKSVSFPTQGPDKGDFVWINSNSFDGTTARCRVSGSLFDYAHGDYKTRIYATNANNVSGYLGSRILTWNSTMPKPELLDIWYENIDANGFDIVCKVKNARSVSFPTRGPNNDDFVWIDQSEIYGMTDGSIARGRVDSSIFNNTHGDYKTRIYISDYSGERQWGDSRILTWNGTMPEPELLDIWYENIDANGFDIVCKVKNARSVSFPTRGPNNDDFVWIDQSEIYGMTDGSIARGRVDSSIFNNMHGDYKTRIYISDYSGERQWGDSRILTWNGTMPEPELLDISYESIDFDGFYVICEVKNAREISLEVIGSNQVPVTVSDYTFVGSTNGSVAQFRVDTSKYDNNSDSYILNITAMDYNNNIIDLGNNTLIWGTEPSATPTTPPSGDGATITVSAVTASAGDSVNVTVDISGNKGFSNLGIEIGYNSSVMTLEKVTPNTAVGAQCTAGQTLTANPYNLTWDSATSDNTYNGTLATFTFKLNSDIADGEYPITVSHYKGFDGSYTDGEDINYNLAKQPLNLKYTNGKITVTSHKPGDINGNGKVNNQDGTMLLQFLAGWDVNAVPAALDVSGNGKVNNQDGTLLLQFLAGWDVTIH